MDAKLSLQESVAKRLRIARENAGLSQSQIARMMDLHRPTVSEIEAGRRRVSASEIALFANHYNVDADWLLGTSSNASTIRLELAARQLAKLDPADMDRLIELLKTFKMK